MQFLAKFYEGNQTFYSKLSLIINIILLIENIFIILLIFSILLKLEKYIQIYLLYYIVYSLLFILFIIILEYFNEKKILFNNKIFFTILSSYMFLTINIILISLLFGGLFHQYKEKNIKYLKQKEEKYIIAVIIVSILVLFTLVINIIIFHSYNFFNEENVNINLEKDSLNSNSTNESDNDYNITIFENLNNKIYFQEIIIENLNQEMTDSYTQTL